MIYGAAQQGGAAGLALLALAGGGLYLAARMSDRLIFPAGKGGRGQQEERKPDPDDLTTCQRFGHEWVTDDEEGDEHIWRCDVEEVNPEMLIGTANDLATGRHRHGVGPEEQLEADSVG